MQQDINGLLQAIYDGYQKPLRILALAIGVPEKDVEDVVQETIIAYYTHYPLDWEEGAMKYMLTTILRNKCIDHFRKYQREWLILDSDQFNEDWEAVFQYGHDLADYVIDKEIGQDVRAAFAQLTESMQLPAKLYLVDGIPEREIAKMLDITPVACRARVSIAKKLLRKLLGSKYGL